MKSIQNFEGLYSITKDGKVWSHLGKGKWRKFGLINDGYFQINLRKNNKNNFFLIHRLVALAYIPNPQNKPRVNHINSKRTDNRVKNLEWVTHSEDIKHSYDFGNRKPIFKKGENHGRAKLTLTQVLEIRKRKQPEDFYTNKIWKEYGISRVHYQAILNSKSWKELTTQNT